MFSETSICFFIIINLFYYIFSKSPKTKSFLCLIAFSLSLFSTILNYKFLEIYPNKPLFMTNIVNSYMCQYLLIDLFYELMKTKKRLDIIIHHVFTLCLFIYLFDYYASTFVTLAEIISIWGVFDFSDTIKKYLRLVSLFPIRTFIWYKIYSLSFCGVLSYTDSIICIIIAIIMSGLDIFWFIKTSYS